MRDKGARLVVIDPVSAALVDVDISQTGPVRAFLRELTREAAVAGAGVLLVAHSTKAARNAVAKGEDPGAGIVAGSAATMALVVSWPCRAIRGAMIGCWNASKRTTAAPAGVPA